MYMPKFIIPQYQLKDHLEVFSIYPFLIKEEEKNNTVEELYIVFTIKCLKEQTSF